MSLLVTAKLAITSCLAIVLLIVCACPVVAMDKAPQSLFEHYNVPTAFQVQRDMTKSLAQYIVGPAGWWYPDVELPHGCFVYSVAAHPTLPWVFTAAEDGNMRGWDLKENTQISNYKKATVVPLEGEMNTVTLNRNFSICANALNRCVVATVNKAEITIGSDINIRSALPHPFKKELLIVSSVDTIPHNGQFKRKDFVKVVDLETKKTLVEFGTHYYPVQRNVRAMALHPEGCLFALGQHTRLALWNDAWKKVGVVAHDSPISAVAFNGQGTMLATACHNGAVGLFDLHGMELPSIRHWRCSLDSRLHSQGTPEINDIKFHPNGKLLAIASQQGFIQLKDVVGARLVQISQHAIVKELTFLSGGTGLVAVGGNNSTVLKNKDNAAVVWKQYQNPTLLQVLLRRRLQEFLVGCRVLCIDPEVACTTKDDFVPWMAERFNLKEDELKATWESMPQDLRQSIFETLISRAQKIQVVHAQYRAKEQALKKQTLE
ncbi:MAG: WD40 repeat domain-containing protein [Candidatus Babeliales bacterium]